MENESKDNPLKTNFNPLIEKYTSLLLEDLLSDGIIQKVENSEKSYRLTNRSSKDTAIADPKKLDTDIAIQNILDFRELSKSIYYNLHDLSASETEQILVSTIIESFVNLDILKLPNLGSSRLKNILDKGKILLNDEEIKQDAIELLDIQNNYSLYVGSLLEYYVKQMVNKEFPSLNLTSNYKIGDEEIDLVGVNADINEPNVLFEIKYRKRALNSLKDDLFYAFEKMSKYDRINTKDTCLVIVIFTDEGSDVLEKIDYRYKQYLEEFFPSFVDRIFLISLYIKNSHLIKGELKKLNLRISQSNANILEFNLLSQAPPASIKEIDDHIYEKIFNLSKYAYEITVTPIVEMSHWRVGLRFSQDSSFPPREKRHAKGFHLFHVEKNADSTDLKISYYDQSGNQQIYGKSTTMVDYRQDTFIFHVSYDNSETKINLLDKNRDSILSEPLIILNYPWFMLSAWADSRNKFDFKVLTKEKKLKIPKGIIRPMPKKDLSSVNIQVHDQDNTPVPNCHIVLLAENNTYHEGFTSEMGQLNLQPPTENKYSILAAHANHPSVILDKFDLNNDVAITLRKHATSGSIICSSGTGNIPGLEGRLNPILDTSFRKYLYADNISIDGGKQQPVHFEIDDPLLLEDKNGVVKKVLIRFIKGRTTILDFL